MKLFYGGIKIHCGEGNVPSLELPILKVYHKKQKFGNILLKLYSTVRAKQLQNYNTNYARNFLSQIFFSKFSRNYNNAHILRKFITGHFFTVGLAFIMILCNEKTFKA